jgi:hypothetical protein
MTPGRRKHFAAAAAALIALLVAVLPSSAAAFGPETGSTLGQATHYHHLAVPGIVRAEVVIHKLPSDAALAGSALAGLALLGWAVRRGHRDDLRPAPLPIRAGRDPPPFR